MKNVIKTIILSAVFISTNASASKQDEVIKGCNMAFEIFNKIALKILLEKRYMTP